MSALLPGGKAGLHPTPGQQWGSPALVWPLGLHHSGTTHRRHPLPTSPVVKCSGPCPADEFTGLGASGYWFPKHHDSIFDSRAQVPLGIAVVLLPLLPAFARPRERTALSQLCRVTGFSVRYLHHPGAEISPSLDLMFCPSSNLRHLTSPWKL